MRIIPIFRIVNIMSRDRWKDNARLYQERGRVYLLKGDKEKAAADLKRAIELNPESENLITGNFKNYEAKNG